MSLSYKQALENFKKAEEELEKARESELEKIVAEIKDKIAEFGLTATDLGFKVAAKKATDSKKGDAKYANPANSAETWSGKGRKPAWYVEHLAKGGKPEDLAIKK